MRPDGRASVIHAVPNPVPLVLPMESTTHTIHPKDDQSGLSHLPAGHMMVNKQPYDQYFKTLPRRNDVITPFAVTDTLGSFDVMVNVIGGGTTGQSQVQ